MSKLRWVAVYAVSGGARKLKWGGRSNHDAAERRRSLAGPGSVAWEINSEVVLLLGWGRAMLLQVAHPLVAAAVADWSSFRGHPGAWLHRLSRTLGSMQAFAFGTTEDISRASANINTIHERVRGRLSQPAGIFPAGTEYSAGDPLLLRWVHVTLVDSFLRAYELYVGPLTLEEKDRYCAEASVIGPLLGIPEGYLPTSMTSLHEQMSGTLAAGHIAVTETARALARELLSPPFPRAAGPVLRLMGLSVIGQLPPEIREMYGFSWDARREAALQRTAGFVRHVLPLVPSPFRYWPAARRDAGTYPPGSEPAAGGAPVPLEHSRPHSLAEA